MPLRVLISILNWNNPDATINCLKSVYTLDYDNYDVLVVDNDSSDDSVSIIKTTFPQQKIHVTDENLGFAGGHTEALAYLFDGKYDALWILNNDTVVEKNSLSNLVDAVGKYGTLSLYSSVPFRSKDNDTIAFAAKYLRSSCYKENALRTDLPITYSELFHSNKARSVAALPGSCLLVPTPVIERYGFMSLDYFLYGEEIDYCLRLKKHGVHCYMIPISHVYHEGEGTRKANPKLSAVIAYYRTRGMIVKSMRYDPIHTTIIVILQQLRIAMRLLYSGLVDGSATHFAAKMVIRAIIDSIVHNYGKTVAPEDYTN